MKRGFSCKSKIIRIFITCALLISLVPAAALANTQSPPFQTPSIYGHTYTFTSEVWYRSGLGTVESVTPIYANTVVPTGYMGAESRLFNQYGDLWATSSMKYNLYEASNFLVYSTVVSTPGQYYAKNIGSFYNGNGYTEFYGPQSPNQPLPASKSSSLNPAETPQTIIDLMLQTKYPVNRNGETYGSALSAYTIGTEPDLISAIGTNGVKGYVKAKELTPKFSSIEEAIAYSKNDDTQIIPLYDADGTTVIGQFEMINGHE